MTGTTLYEVSVERTTTGYSHVMHIMTAAPAGKPELAAEAAERIAARGLYGDDWASAVHQFFAFRVKKLTAKCLMEREKARMWAIENAS